MAQTESASTASGLVRGLALEGIATSIAKGTPALPAGKDNHPAAVKPGESISSNGGLLSLTEVLSDGTRVTFSASQAETSRSIHNLLVLEVGIGLAALVVVGLLVRRATTVALRPLSEVADTAAAIAGGDRARRLRPDRTDTELGRVAAAFDGMVDALDQAVTVSARSEETMRRFLAEAAHELRTPIAALQATAERLLRDQPERPERDEIEASVAAGAARLGRLVAELLDLARLEAGGVPPGNTVDLGAVTVAAAAEVCSEACFDIRVDPEPLRVRGDASAIARAVRNLLDNAVAAAGPAGHVKVSASASPDGVEINVSDDGPGIPAADREQIFEPFTRLEPGSGNGTGLGLAIARRIARQHGGDLICKAVPTGASFTLRLPRSVDRVERFDTDPPGDISEAGVVGASSRPNEGSR